MKIFHTINDMQKFSRQQQRLGKTIGVVPTMGYLHAGHLSLIDAAKIHADIVIVTIFVNPTQFSPNEDLSNYPRDFDRDCELCEAHNVTAIFAPEPEEMYAENCTTWVNETSLSQGLCAKSRPEHFRGVTTIVTKLFNAVLPDIALFGQKDAQQAAVICRMVRDLNFPIKVIVSPLIREADGLAMSSRNRYLSKIERQKAPTIFKALQAAKSVIEQQGLPNSSNSVVRNIRNTIESAGGKIDYIQLMDNETLRPTSQATTEILIAVAIFFGKTRLLDNIIIKL